jgi:hypothetical protein
MEELRASVQDGFQRIPHGGIEEGGILYGRLEGECIRILEWRRIACDHAAGPTFTLSEADLERLRVQMEKRAPELLDLIPVGWYASHSRSGLLLKPADMELHRARFPEPWHVILLIQAAKDGPAKGAFFLREAGGNLPPEPVGEAFEIVPDPKRQGAGRLTAARAEPASEPEVRRRRMPYTPPRAAASIPPAPPRPVSVPPILPPAMETVSDAGPSPLAALPPAAEATPVAPPVPAAGPTPAVEPVPPKTELPHPAPQAAAPEPPPAAAAETPLPAFAAITAVPPSRILERLAWVAAFGALGAGVMIAVPRMIPPERAALSLQVVEVKGAAAPQIHFKWALNAPAIENAERATVEVADGMTTKIIDLDADEIQRGSLTYVRQSGDVQVRMTVFRRGDLGRVQELARYIGPYSEPAVVEPAAASADKFESEHLAVDTEKLRRLLVQEQARTRRLEQSVATIQARLEKENTPNR